MTDKIITPPKKEKSVKPDDSVATDKQTLKLDKAESSKLETSTPEPTTTEEQATSVKPAKPKKSKRSVPSGQFHIFASFNNTIVTFTDSSGNALTSSSAGACGFRGSKKGTAYAAQVATEKAAANARQGYGLSKVNVLIKGIGLGREAAVRTLQGQSIQVESITDVTGIPHGGVRPPKARRV